MIRATLRLQLHKDFPFDAAAERVPYFAKLGISHLYLSPILTARPGSTHGYDTLDYGTVNPELGGEGGLRRLHSIAKAQGLGLVVDIVPNHMAADEANPWWWDLLAHGRGSRYAKYFDIDWNSANPLLMNRLLWPILGRPYGEALVAGELKVVEEGGARVLRYFDRRAPITPAQGPLPANAQDLHALLERQHYRIAWWRTANDELNWRRFFEITGLAGVRVGLPEVFDAVHGKILELYRDGVIDGVRVDHVDGLSDPRGYCRRLRRALRQAHLGHPRASGGPWIVVEKVLGPGEALPRDWGVAGTTGYDFMDDVSALLHDPRGAEALTALWHEMSGDARDFPAQAREARRLLAARNFNAEVQAATRELVGLARADPQARDRTRASISRALVELLAWFGNYRPEPGGSTAALEAALRAAAEPLREPERSALHWIGRVLGDDGRRTWRARRRVAQLMAPLAGKAVEDTAFYRYGRLLSRCEVGSDPARLAMEPAEFHSRCAGRARRWPDALLATATHDHKRGEDARARLAVLSELPDEWARLVRRWRRRHEALKVDGAPDGADQYILYQALLGAWPCVIPSEARDLFISRILAWQQKALREAKRHTDWLAIGERYEVGCRAFLEKLLGDDDFNDEMDAFVTRIAPPAVLNSLAQVLLRLTTPGVPDLYQGGELWDFSLVDPDNRRPVDFDVREHSFDATTPLSGLLQSWRDGRVKQALVARVLALRAKMPELFSHGDYRPLSASGVHAAHVLAFERRHRGQRLVVVVPYRTARLAMRSAPGVVPREWRDTALTLGAGQWTEALGGVEVGGGVVELKRVLGQLPLAVFVAR